MKRKVCLALGLLLLLMPLAIFSVQATGADTAEWAVVNYLYDPDVEGEEPTGGVLSFGKDVKNYLRRYNTLSWNAQVLEVTVTAISKKSAAPTITVSEGIGTCYIFWAGEYTVTAKNVATGESVSCNVTMMPVVQMSGEYLAFNNATGKFWRATYNFHPVLICDNVDRMELDMSDILSGTRFDQFLADREKPLFGEHLLKFSCGSYATTVYVDVFACLAQKVFDEELGKNCLLLSVGDFGEGFSVFLDGAPDPLTPGVHKITAVGQHTITAKQTVNGVKQSVSRVSPAPKDLNLQVQLILAGLELEEPITLQLSKWDAVFYVNGSRINGDYRVARSGKNAITAYDQNGNLIEGAFLVKSVGSDEGTQYTELVLDFDNPHFILGIIMIFPAVLMIAAAVFFFLRRRRIV